MLLGLFHEHALQKVIVLLAICNQCSHVKFAWLVWYHTSSSDTYRGQGNKEAGQPSLNFSYVASSSVCRRLRPICRRLRPKTEEMLIKRALPLPVHFNLFASKSAKICFGLCFAQFEKEFLCCGKCVLVSFLMLCSIWMTSETRPSDLLWGNNILLLFKGIVYENSLQIPNWMF